MLTGIAGLHVLAVGALVLPSVFWPTPKAVQTKPTLVVTSPANIVAPATLSRPASLLRKQIGKIFPQQNIPVKDRTKIVIQLSPKSLTRPEEYLLEAQGRTVTIKAHDEQGAFWAVHSLLQHIRCEQIRQSKKGFELPGIRLHDWPETDFRAFMIQAAWSGTPDELKENLDLLARYKIKYFALEFGPRVVLDFDPSIARYGNPDLMLTKKQAKEIIDYGRSLGMEPIAYLNTLAHLERAYQKSPYTDHGGIMLQNQQSYDEFVYPVLSEMLYVYGPVKYFHCGMDEAWDLFTYYSEQNMDTSGLITQHITKVNEFLQKRNMRMVIWHDMLIAPEMKSEFGASIGPANGGKPFNTSSALKSIPKSVILDYWNYDPFDKFPAIDYFKKQGFQVWASPWYVPFSIVNYSASIGVPTMGTLWADPPGCFTFSPSDAATALYAQAAWNTSKSKIGGEAAVKNAAIDATTALLYGRPRQGIGLDNKLRIIRGADVLNASDVDITNIPKDAIVSYGIPFDFSKPAVYRPAAFASKSIKSVESAVYVNVPGDQRLKLDGVNTGRGEDQLILYMAPQTSSNTNIYGAEVAVSSTGEVISITDYGSSDTRIPEGGFVLSAHSGASGDKARRLLGLRVGDHISVLDQNSNWVGGYQPLVLWARLPNGDRQRIDWVDNPRDSGQMILYEYGYGNNRTGTDNQGVEVAIDNGKVVEVNLTSGNTQIPPGGYVLSAHSSSPAAGENALKSLRPGQSVEIETEINGIQTNLSALLTSNKWKAAVDLPAQRILVASATNISLVPGTAVGSFIVNYADGSVSRTVFRYGQHVISQSGKDVPRSMSSDTWLMHPSRAYKPCIVYEWINHKPGVKVKNIQFMPNLHSLQSGNVIYGVTIVSDKHSKNVK